MIDTGTGSRNILEEKTAQDVADSIIGCVRHLKDTKEKYSFLKDTESRIEEAIRRIDEYEEALKECLDGKPQMKKLSFGDFLILGCDVKADGKILSGIEKQKFLRERINDCFRAKRNWEKVSKMLREEYLPIISDALNDPPPYLDNLFCNKLLDLKTMEVLCPLKVFAFKLRKELGGILLTKNHLIDFKKKGGKPYSERMIRYALAYANSKEITEK